MREGSKGVASHALAGLLALVASALILVAGCGSKKKPRDDDDARATPTASAAPPAPTTGQKITDERLEDLDYKFIARRPDKSWRLVGEEDAQALGVASVRAGFLGPSSLLGSIAIDEVSETNLDERVDDILRSKGAVQLQVEERSELTFAGVPARRLAIAIVDGASARRECDLLFHVRGFLFVIGATQPASQAQPRGCGFLEPFLATFSIEDGQPVSRPPVVPKGDVVGGTFRLRDGVFESAAGRLRVRRADNATMVAGDAARSLYGPAEVAVLYASPPAVLTLRSEEAALLQPTAALDGYAAQLAQYVGAVPSGRTTTVPFLGRELQLRELDTPAFSWWIGLDYEGGRATLVAGWTPKGTREPAAALIRATIGAVEPIDPSAALKLQTEIDATPFEENVAELGYSLRRGVYHDYLWGLRWTRPERGWSVQVGQAARAIDPYALLTASLRGADVQCSLEVFEQRLPAAEFHKVLRDLLTTQAAMAWGKSTKLKLDGRDALRSTGVNPTTGMAYRATTHADPRYDMAVLCYGPKAALDAHPEAADAFEGALRFDATLALSEGASEIVDRQLGFSIALGPPWRLRSNASATGHGIVGSDPAARVVEALAFQSRPNVDASFAIAFVILAELPMLGLAATDDPPSTSDTTLAGRPAKRFVFKAQTGESIEAVSMQVGQVRYAIIARGAGAYAEAVAGFNLLPD